MKMVNISSDNIFQEIEKVRLAGEDKLSTVSAAVEEIIDTVKEDGDDALRAYAQKFDDAAVEDIIVSEEEIACALKNIPQAEIELFQRAIDNIRAYHSLLLPQEKILRRSGAVLRQIYRPIERVGVYIPGGKTIYPSTVLMNVIPAKVAGVLHIALASPPDKNGRLPDRILAAAHLAGADVLYKMGGAQAIAAFAYGTQSVQPVYKITGPGNVFVAEAKRMLYGKVDIDMIAGPSEILIIADETANAACIAADLLSQAEHDEQALCILITTSAALAAEVEQMLYAQLDNSVFGRRAKSAIENNGVIFIVEDIKTAVEMSNEIAPEHLELMTAEPNAIVGDIQNAGSIFLGVYTPEAVGDYFAGVNHTIPTSGKAKFSSPLDTMDFIKHSNVIEYSKEAFLAIQQDVAAFANLEDFTYHAASALRRQ